MKTMLAIVAALAAAGCLRTTSYKCGSNEQCGTGGVCEAAGYCSFEDSSCTGGRRYGESSGTYSSKCVGDVIVDADGGVDAPGDGPMTDDAMVGNCPGSYVAVGGQTHVYRVITATADWTTQNTDCGNDAPGTSSYLAVPDDQTELTAILTAAGGNAWVGANDMQTENTYVTSNGGTLASNSALWDATDAEPNDDPEMGGGQNNSDCVLGLMGLGKLADDRCQNTYRAVCECEP